MKTKQKFWKILIGVLLYSLISHWKDAKQGWIDGINESRNISTQTQPK